MSAPKSKFYYRPRVGDVWEFKTPTKPKRKKTVGKIFSTYHSMSDKSKQVRLPRVHWKRLPKGRYSSMRVKWLLKYGRLISRNGVKENV